MITAAAPRIVVPGRNAWCVEHADRFHAIQDGDYFRLFRDALLRATRTVFVLGWDITGSIDLLPGTDVSDGAPTRLDRLIAYVARRRPGLEKPRSPTPLCPRL